jgi:RNA polymerase sigma-70 factor (ECF subfamily)
MLATEVVLNGRKDETVPTIEQGRPPAEGSYDSGSASDGGESLDLSQALDRLPPDARRIFVLHDVEGYTHEDLAEIFGITPGGSKARLQRARVLLKEALGR